MDWVVMYERGKTRVRDTYLAILGEVSREREKIVQKCETLEGRLNKLQAQLEKKESIIKELETHAYEDPLTHAYNRRMLEKDLIAQADLKKRNFGYEYTLLIFDVEKFKAINEQHGHATGDSLLCYLKQYWTKILRPSDKLYRWGGDEFVIVLPNTTAQTTSSVLQRLSTEVNLSDILSEARSCEKIQIGLHLDIKEGTDDGVALYHALGTFLDSAKHKS